MGWRRIQWAEQLCADVDLVLRACQGLKDLEGPKNLARIMEEEAWQFLGPCTEDGFMRDRGTTRGGFCFIPPSLSVTFVCVVNMKHGMGKNRRRPNCKVYRDHSIKDPYMSDSLGFRCNRHGCSEPLMWLSDANDTLIH